jgi:hypothetical protein
VRLLRRYEVLACQTVRFGPDLHSRPVPTSTNLATINTNPRAEATGRGAAGGAVAALFNVSTQFAQMQMKGPRQYAKYALAKQAKARK